MNLCYDLDTYGKNGQQTFLFPGATYKPHWGDNIESWWCGKNLKYQFCTNANGDCGGILGQSGAGNTKTAVMDSAHADKTNRVKLQYYDPLEIGAVTVFSAYDCQQQTGRFDAAADPRETAYYNTDDMQKRHIQVDTVSSVMVPQGYTVKLYTDDGFLG